MAMEKTFNAGAEEARISEKWLEADVFRAGANKSRDEAFSILLPPPNVTGVLHMGHAFNQSLMDILIRWHRMRGFDTLWQPGLDHAGIATQMVVERELANNGEPSRQELGREVFLEKVWEWKERSGGQIVEQSKRLGTSMDWSREAFTMSGHFHDAVIKVFVDMYNKGLIYRGKRLVNWDPHFETAISDLEVENTEVAGHMWHFKYPLKDGESYTYIEKDEDGNVVLEEERDYISIATTRPETMLGDGAVAVHPDDERYAPIVGKLCQIPVGPKEHRRFIPIITDEYPDPDFGSGAVKITGAHDFNDYQVAKRGGIPMYNLMDSKGAMRADGAPFAEIAVVAQAIADGEREFDEAMIAGMNLVSDEYRGLDRFEARMRVVADIDAEGLMIKVEDKPIMQPFGDRSKVVIEPMLTDQWFVDTAKIVGPAIEAVETGEVNIYPEQDKKVYFNWLRNIEPWCISRQLWWGHQIPVWYDEEGHEYCAPSEAEAQAMAGDRVLERDPDVLDTWFSSGLWPIGTLGWPEDTPEMQRYFPTSVLITGFDIIFFWVARMMMMQYAVVGKKPFSDVYVHALVRDEKGKKMSKSLGNVLDPIELIDQFGADAVRFTLASMAAMGRDLKLSVSRIEGYRNFATKIWNAARFAEMNEAFAPEDFDPNVVKAEVNAWIIGEVAKARMANDAALEEYRFNDAANGLYAFTWHKLCDWYVEFAKPLLNGEDEEVRAETRATLGWAIDQAITLLHPVMPFVTEAIWEARGDAKNMLALEDWPEYGVELVRADADAEINWVIALIERIRSTRAELHVPAGAKLTLEKLELDAAQAGYFERNYPLVERLARIEAVEDVDEASKGAVAIPVEGGQFALPLAGVVDADAEIARLEKSIEKLGKEAGGLNGRLGNPKFLESAPEAVVADARARADEIQGELAKLEAARERMQALL